MAEPAEAPPAGQPAPPGLFEKLSLIGTMRFVVLPILKDLLAEMKETNRLRRLYYSKQGIPTAQLVDPRDFPAPDRAAAVRDDVEITQPTDQYFAELEQRRAALRERGIYVDDNDDLDEAERLADGR